MAFLLQFLRRHHLHDALKPRATSFTFDVTQSVRSVAMTQTIGVLPMMPWKIPAAPSACATFANVSSMGREAC
jgi:hypothetical protein